ncbi:MAG: hypothetical protein RI911_187, partial [Candidatus Parcubacteria bacterium]
MAQGWENRIPPKDYAASEGAFVVHDVLQQRHDTSIQAADKVSVSDVVDLTTEHYKTALAFQRKIYDAFHMQSTEALRTHFDPTDPLCFLPKEHPVVDIEALVLEARKLATDRKIPSYMQNQFIRALDDISHRRSWVSALMQESYIGAKTRKDALLNCFRLVTGETEVTPNLISVVITPVAVHFICGDKETALRITTSQERTVKEGDGQLSLRPFSQEIISKQEDFLGMALTNGVWRPGGKHAVSVGISNPTEVQRKSPKAIDDAFETFRHEFDHLLFSLREHMHQEQDNYEIRKLEARFETLHGSVIPADWNVREELFAQMHAVAATMYYYSHFEKGNTAVRGANEFISQYLDRGADYAKQRVVESYRRSHLPDDINASCERFFTQWAEYCDKKRRSLVAIEARDYPYSYEKRVLEIREHQIVNAVAACKRLESYGFSNHEVADMLRMVPFNRWLAFSRRYGAELAKDRKINQETKEVRDLMSLSDAEFDILLRERTPVAEELSNMRADL